MSAEIKIPTDPIGRKIFGSLLGIGVNPDAISQVLTNASELKADVKEFKEAVVELNRSVKEMNSTMQELNRNLKGGS